MIFYCANKDGSYIERIYIFPAWEIIKRTTVTIMKNPSRRVWYEQYRIKDEKILELVNKIWKEIINRNKLK